MVQIFATLIDMSDSCLLHSFLSNSTSHYCDENYMDDVDYFVVMAYDNKYCFDTFACLD
jgi:hypothetical protein